MKIITSITATVGAAALTGGLLFAYDAATPEDQAIPPTPGVTGEQLVGADPAVFTDDGSITIQQAGRTNVHSGGRHNPRHGGGRHGGSHGSRCGCH